MSSRKRPSGSTSRGRSKRARLLPFTSTARVVPPDAATQPSSTFDIVAEVIEHISARPNPLEKTMSRGKRVV